MTTTTIATDDTIRAWMTEQIESLIVPATDDEIRSWLQSQIRGCLQGTGAAWYLREAIESATYEREEIEPLTEHDQETVDRARELIREADGQLSAGAWREARLPMIKAHDMLREVGVAMEIGAWWRRELDLQLNEIESAIEGAMIEPGSLDWLIWQGDDHCAILTRDYYWQQYSLPAVLQSWEDGVPIGIVDDEYLTVLPDWIDDDDQD